MQALKAPKKILFVKMFSIGDVLNSTPALRALRERFQESKIIALAGKWSSEVLHNNPCLNGLIEFDDQILRQKQVKRILQLIAFLRRGHFDAAFILHRSLAINFLIYLTGIPIRMGINWAGRGYFLTHWVYEDPSSKGHEIERYLRVLHPWGIQVKSLNMEVYPEESDQQFAKKILAEYKLPGKTLIGICPGGGKNPGENMPLRRWPIQKYRELVNQLGRRNEYMPILLGGPDDCQYAEEIIRAKPNKFVNLIGQTTILQAAALMALCDVVVTNDSGLMHLAAAAGAPVISIFGPTDPLLKAPLGEKHMFLYAHLSCSPCYQSGKFPDCKTQECMQKISVDEVLKAVDQILGMRQSKRKC